MPSIILSDGFATPARSRDVVNQSIREPSWWLTCKQAGRQGGREGGRDGRMEGVFAHHTQILPAQVRWCLATKLWWVLSCLPQMLFLCHTAVVRWNHLVCVCVCVCVCVRVASKERNVLGS